MNMRALALWSWASAVVIAVGTAAQGTLAATGIVCRTFQSCTIRPTSLLHVELPVVALASMGDTGLPIDVQVPVHCRT